MKNNFKRCLAMLLAIMMVVGACAFPISAADDTNAEVTTGLKCDNVACGSTNTKLLEKVPGSCTTQGHDKWYCNVCGNNFMANVGKFADHKYEWQEAQDDTCVDGVVGRPAGNQCTECGHWEVPFTPEDKQCGTNCIVGANSEIVHDVTPGMGCKHTWDGGHITNGET